jgi:hypothetical protein
MWRPTYTVFMLRTKFLLNICLMLLLWISKFMCAKHLHGIEKNLCSRLQRALWHNWSHSFVLDEWASLQLDCTSGPPWNLKACVLQRQTQPSTIHYLHQQGNNYTIHNLNCYISRVLQHSKVHKVHNSVPSWPPTPRSTRRVRARFFKEELQAFTISYLPLCTSRS